MSERAWLIEVFRLHYQEQLSQNRIAKLLGDNYPVRIATITLACL